MVICLFAFVRSSFFYLARTVRRLLKTVCSFARLIFYASRIVLSVFVFVFRWTFFIFRFIIKLCKISYSCSIFHFNFDYCFFTRSIRVLCRAQIDCFFFYFLFVRDTVTFASSPHASRASFAPFSLLNVKQPLVSPFEFR